MDTPDRPKDGRRGAAEHDWLSRSMQVVGQDVMISGITSRPMLNGQQGFAESFVVATNRVLVVVADGGERLALKAENLKIAAGSVQSATGSTWETLLGLLHALSLNARDERLRACLGNATDEARKEPFPEATRELLVQCMGGDPEAFGQVILLMNARLFCELVHLADKANAAQNHSFFGILNLVRQAMENGYDRYAERMDMRLCAELLLLCYRGPETGEHDDHGLGRLAGQHDNCALAFSSRTHGCRAADEERALQQLRAAFNLLEGYRGNFIAFVATSRARIQDHLGMLYKDRLNGDRAANLEQSLNHYMASLELVSSRPASESIMGIPKERFNPDH